MATTLGPGDRVPMSWLARYWIIDPAAPEGIVHQLSGGVLVERSRHGPGHSITLDVGPGAAVTFDPADLVP